jgi:hypothetical protein
MVQDTYAAALERFVDQAVDPRLVGRQLSVPGAHAQEWGEVVDREPLQLPCEPHGLSPQHGRY